MKILNIVRSLGYGGAPKHLALIANGLARKGHEVYIYSYNWDTPLQKLENVVYIPEEHVIEGSPAKEYFFSIFKIRKQIKKLRPDVVITWRTNAGCLGKLASLGLKVKVLFAEMTDPYLESSKTLNAAKFVCDFSDGGIFQTDSIRDYYKRLSPNGVVIQNPFVLKGGYPDIIDYHDRKKEIAVVGRMFLKQKRQDVALKAFELIHKALPDYKMVFYGDGEDFDKVKAAANKLPIKNSLEFKGSVSNVISYVRQSKVLLLTSDYEGIPNTVLEAFAAGTPVVSTDCSPGGVRVEIDNGINGFIVERGDYESAAARVIEVIKNPKLAEKFIVEGRKKLSYFDYDKVVDKWNDYIIKFRR